MSTHLPHGSPRPDVKDFLTMPTGALVEKFAFGVENFDRRLFELKDAELDTAFFPEAGVGRWPARVLLGHLADADLAQIHRCRRTVAEDHPVLALWDENAFIESGLYGGPQNGASYPAAGFVAVIHTLRKWSSQWLATLTPEQWERTALHPERGAISVRFMAGYITWHLEHHAWYLNRKIEALLMARG